MGFRCGIAGVPNAGKSTLFNALTQSSAAAENYPFCTIEPNFGVVAVADSRLDTIANIIGVARKIHAVLEFVDIAGLVQGAAEGEGLGNRFLAHIREMDLIVHVVRAFDESNDIYSDIATVNIELILADLETVVKAKDRALRRARTGDKTRLNAFNLLNRIESQLEKGESPDLSAISESERVIVDSLHLLSCKPKFYVFNVNENEAEKAHRFASSELDAPLVTICAELEAEISQLSNEEQHLFREEMGLGDSALSDIVQTGYSILGLQTFFTFNDSEVRAWTIPRGKNVSEAAGKIHTDMEKGFIRAEVMSYDDFQFYGDEQAVKNAGLLRFEGRTHQLQDGDIMRVRFRS